MKPATWLCTLALASTLWVGCTDGSPSEVVEPEVVAAFTLTFEATWSLATHPVSFPPGPHFSGLIGATHNMAFRSHLLRFPEQETTAMVACSFPTSDPGSRARRVADAVLGDQLEPAVAAETASTPSGAATDGPSPTLTSEQLDAFVGPWRASVGVEVAIEREDEQLFFLQGPQRMPLGIVAEDRIARATSRPTNLPVAGACRST